MNTQQINNLNNIAAMFSNDYQLSSELYDRHVELIDAVSLSDMDDTFDRSLLRAGVRREILEAAKESCEFEELMSSVKRELTGIIARMDMADKIDSARTAA
ncbi:hypothetical protein GCQ65_19990 [Salmonella enterica]|uniref:hypothetical protein n=1 Tax=Salmonella enterica TaxID=28901 RepID=UPI000B8E533E|nr:hypothetical protein [Salmonella enterica]EBP3719486.1 hypothetical protein [Salmonella enterica subsp. enterica]EDB4091690.1 hypothetical protein [Salmonella enterica subsp. enterica serovar Typhimurium]EAA8644199.1 hypothetical protein [Salmonella enterica]EAQ7262311.1 hypothetical protein [Salmonella enterica]EAT9908286.1 hypothetical protein [Salmonella enterica]